LMNVLSPFPLHQFHLKIVELLNIKWQEYFQQWYKNCNKKG
jgi:hypothetical protein